MAQKEPEKKMPSTTAKAISLSAKVFESVIHRSALCTEGQGWDLWEIHQSRQHEAGMLGNWESWAAVPVVCASADGHSVPVGLLLHARHRLDCVEEVLLLLSVLDVGVNEQAAKRYKRQSAQGCQAAWGPTTGRACMHKGGRTSGAPMGWQLEREWVNL